MAFRPPKGLRPGIRHKTSSLHFPQSNGHAECGVKICKQFLQKHDHHWDKFTFALLEWRNTPRPDGISPAHVMFGRGQRTLLPALPQWDISVARIASSRQARDATMKKLFDQHTNQFPYLAVGDDVIVQDHVTNEWKKHGKIKEYLPHGRSYIITFLDDGQDLRRDR